MKKKYQQYLYRNTENSLNSKQKLISNVLSTEKALVICLKNLKQNDITIKRDLFEEKTLKYTCI